jgi:hypothetical protein
MKINSIVCELLPSKYQSSSTANDTAFLATLTHSPIQQAGNESLRER